MMANSTYFAIRCNHATPRPLLSASNQGSDQPGNGLRHLTYKAVPRPGIHHEQHPHHADRCAGSPRAWISQQLRLYAKREQREQDAVCICQAQRLRAVEYVAVQRVERTKGHDGVVSTTSCRTIFPRLGRSRAERDADGGIRQFDSNYNTYFYVDPTTNPPRTTWTRPGYADGQAAPEQLDTLRDAQGANGGGEAAEYFAGPQPVSHHTAGFAQEAKQAQQGGEAGAGNGERGFVSSMATNMVMSKLGLRPTVSETKDGSDDRVPRVWWASSRRAFSE